VSLLAINTDRAANKRTVAVRIGARRTQFEYMALLTLAYLVPTLLALGGDLKAWIFWLPFATVPMALKFVRGVTTLEGRPLNKMLGGTAQLTLFYGLLFTVAIALS